MKVNDFHLQFDQPDARYYSGHIVSGRVHVALKRPTKLCSVVVQFKGEANTRWQEEKKDDDDKEVIIIEYHDNDLYFENNVRVHGGVDAARVFPSGKHFFPFSMILPPNLPPSFTGKHGNISYTVTATIDNPGSGLLTKMMYFTVLPIVDLNFDPRNRKPVAREESMNFCCFCCSSGPLTLTTKVPTKGYIVGQRIPLYVEVDNGSNVRIKKVECNFEQINMYYSASPKGSKEDVVVFKTEIEESSIDKHDSKSWSLEIPIPNVPPSMLQSCSIIDVYYRMTVKAVSRGMHTNLECEFPILIGTIPFSQNAAQQPLAPAMYSNMPMPMPMPAPTAPPLTLGAPPSYEETTGIKF